MAGLFTTSRHADIRPRHVCVLSGQLCCLHQEGAPKAAPLSSGGALQVAALVAEHMLAEVDAHQLASDAAAAQVWKGAEDGRLLRVLVRLGSVLERPQAEGDPQWAETGMAMQTVQGG